MRHPNSRLRCNNDRSTTEKATDYFSEDRLCVRFGESCGETAMIASNIELVSEMGLDEHE